MRQLKGMIWVLLGVLILAGAAAVTMDNLMYSVKKESDGNWYVVNERNQRLPIEARANDMVVWTADGSDMRFEFMEESDQIFLMEDRTPVPANYVVEVKNGRKLRLWVKDGAPKDRYEYEVYVKVDSVYALGSSPPVIIIK